MFENGVELVEEVEQQRRGDVVGQVADQAQRRPVAAQRAEVELERVGEVHAQLAVPAAAPLEFRHDVAVDLDDVERGRPLRAAAR